MADEKKKPAKLSGAALRKLRALGHSLDPVIAVGKDGITDALVRATDLALATHELIKVKIQREAPTDRHEGAIELAARTGSVLAQVIGRTALLYRRRPDDADKKKAKKAKPRIDLSTKGLRKEPRPANRRPAPRPQASEGAEGEDDAWAADDETTGEGEAGDN